MLHRVTFGMAFAGLAYVGIVSDRRLSGARLDDDAGKCGVVEYRDGLLTYTSAGLAEVPSRQFRAREWMAHWLLDAGIGGVGADHALARFASIAGQAMDELASGGPGQRPVRRDDTKSTFVFAGFVRLNGRANRRLYMISNFETAIEANATVGQFQTSIITVPDGRSDLMLIGSGRQYIQRAEIDRLLMLLANPTVPPEEFAHVAVQIVREVARRDPSASVGGQCSSAILRHPPNHDPLFTEYYPDAPAKTVQSTDFVGATYGTGGGYCIIDAHYSGGADAPDYFQAKSSSDWIAAVPRVSKNAPCPCGSGRKYRSCHARRRGRPGSRSMYAGMTFRVTQPPTEDQTISASVDAAGREGLRLVLKASPNPELAASADFELLDAGGGVLDRFALELNERSTWLE